MYYPRKESQKNTHFILGIAQIGWDPTAQMDLDPFLKVKKILKMMCRGPGWTRLPKLILTLILF